VPAALEVAHRLAARLELDGVASGLGRVGHRRRGG
jgi:hypothetical protein